MCRICGEEGESVNHVTNECSKLAQREHKRHHDNVAPYVHWQLCRKTELKRTDKWYKHTPERVVENEGFKVLWDFNVQCDRMVEARRPDVVFVDKQAMKAKIIVIAIPGDARVKYKELEKIEKYKLVREEVRKLWKLMKVTVVPVVIGALRAVSDVFDKRMEKLGTTIRIVVIQKTAQLRTATIIRNVFSL